MLFLFILNLLADEGRNQGQNTQNQQGDEVMGLNANSLYLF